MKDHRISIQALTLSEIFCDSRLQIRVAINEQTVGEYTQLFADEAWPFREPITVFEIDGKFYLADGFHRVLAAERAGRTIVSANVKQGKWGDAFEFALSANGRHGLRRSNADKRNAVQRALITPAYRELSNRKLAKLCGVSEAFVRKIKKSLPSLPEAFEGMKSSLLQLAEQTFSANAVDAAIGNMPFCEGFDSNAQESRNLYRRILESNQSDPSINETIEDFMNLSLVAIHSHVANRTWS